MRHPLVLAAILALAIPVRGSALAQILDADQSRAYPAGSVTAEGNGIAVTVRMDGGMGGAEIRFREALETTGRQRFVVEARADETTKTFLCVSRTELLGRDGAVCSYEPDFLFPPTWCLSEVCTAEMPSNLPGEVTGLRLTFWGPYDTGREVCLHLRRLEFQTLAELAAEIRPGPARRRPLPVRSTPPGPGEDRWGSISPGGGGWFRTLAISPHDGACFVGGDVGGVYRSRDRERSFDICNRGLTNTYINSIAFHPTDPRRVFVGTNGGPARSDDGGDTWRMLLRGLPPLRTFALDNPISSLLVDRADPRRVWAGVGRERDYGRLDAGARGGRVLVSDEGGDNWHEVRLPLGTETDAASVLSLEQSGSDPRVLFATTPAGVCRSEDRGETWARLATPGGYDLCFLAVHPRDPQTVLVSYRAGPGSRGGVLRSTDGGASWQEANEGLPAEASVWRLIADPGTPGRFILSYNGHAGLYETGDSGATWRAFSPGAATRWSWAYAHALGTGLGVDPRDPLRVLLCDDIDILETLDGGKTWDSVIADNVLAAAPDRPATWRGRSCDILCMGGPQAVAVDPSDPRRLFAGYWDLHLWRSDDGGQSLSRVVSGTTCGFGRAGAILLDPGNPDVMWVSVGENEARQRIYLSVNGGRSFRLVGHEASGLPPGGVFTLVLDPTSPSDRRTLLAGVAGYGIYRSTDGGMTWADRSAALPADSRMIKQIALDPVNPRRMYVAAGAHYHEGTHQRTRGYLAVSDDGGDHWRVTKPDVEAQCLLVDPTDPRRVYAGNRNYSGVDYPNAFYYSTDAGETWTAVDQEAFAEGPGRPDGTDGWRTFVAALAADPTQPGVLYAGLTNEMYNVDNGRGVFISRDWGRTWSPFPADGLSGLRVGTIVVDPVNPQRLYVGTGGNGLFRWGPEP
jgi:photosystem II stability/assembly factor-like uncharacterized protein